MKTNMELHRDVLEEISWEPIVAGPEIRITSNDGVVTLSGSVETLPAKWAAGEAALRVSGVCAVVNNLEVKLTTDNHRSDNEIVSVARTVLEWNVLLPKNLQVVVKDGWITLTGKVQWQFQKIAAEETVKQLIGVKGVINKITVKSRSSANALQRKIEAALQRCAIIDAGKIRVVNEDGKITLEGTVGSWIEKTQVEKAAWSAPGIAQVENKLSIQNRKA